MPEVETTALSSEYRDDTPYRPPVYSDELWDDCLALYLKGFGSRNVRRILSEKYKKVPPSNTIRKKIAKYPQKIRDAVGKSKEMDMLVALAANREYYEDVSQDIMSYARPSFQKKVEEGGWDSVPFKDHADFISKENNLRWQREQKKIEHLDPARNQQQIPIFIQLAMKQSSQPGENNGSSDSTTGKSVIDAEFEQVADIPATGLPSQTGDTD